MSKRVRINTGAGSSSDKKPKKGNFEDEKAGGDAKGETSGLNKSKPSRLKDNNTIESDEEEQEEQREKFERLNEEDVIGAEDSDVGDEFDDDEEEKGIEITPFNLKEEMAEGDFDQQGHYHFKKDTDIRDNWMDEIDWSQVKKNEKHKKLQYNDDDEDDNQESLDELKTLEGIVKHMKAGETVQKSLRRLGGSGKKSSSSNTNRKWKRQSVYDLEDQEEEEDESNGSKDAQAEKEKENFLELTELVDRLAGSGYYDIYTDSYEKIQYKIKSKKPAAPVIPDNTDADDALDMFGDDFDNRKDDKKDKKEAASSPVAASSSPTSSIMWEYKWSTDQDQVYGPFPTKQMMQWKEANYFPEAVITRKVASSSSSQGSTNTAAFYPLSRVDFDLYDD